MGSEVYPTERESQIISFIEGIVDDVVSSYGGDADAATPSRIHIVPLGTVENLADGGGAGGFHDFEGHYIVIERDFSELRFALRLAHELLHLKSYKAAQVHSDGTVGPFRSGVLIFSRDGSEQYFEDLEEGIVSEVSRQIYRASLEKDQRLRREIEATEQLKPWVDQWLEKSGFRQEERGHRIEQLLVIPTAPEILAHTATRPRLDLAEQRNYYFHRFEELDREGELRLLPRRRERERLYSLMDAIIDQSQGEFRTREELFPIFAKANFTGNLLPLARLLHRLFGRGSFRYLAYQDRKRLDSRPEPEK